MNIEAEISRHKRIRYLRTRKGYSYVEIARIMRMTRIRVIRLSRNRPIRENEIPPHFTGTYRTRELVRMRDNRTCQSCLRKWKQGERRLDVHHLGGMCGKKSKKYDRVADMPHLLTLCHRCHFNHKEHSMKIKRK